MVLDLSFTAFIDLDRPFENMFLKGLQIKQIGTMTLYCMYKKEENKKRLDKKTAFFLYNYLKLNENVTPKASSTLLNSL